MSRPPSANSESCDIIDYIDIALIKKKGAYVTLRSERHISRLDFVQLHSWATTWLA